MCRYFEFFLFSLFIGRKCRGTEAREENQKVCCFRKGDLYENLWARLDVLGEHYDSNGKR